MPCIPKTKPSKKEGKFDLVEIHPAEPADDVPMGATEQPGATTRKD